MSLLKIGARTPLNILVRYAHWNKDWKPGPVPKTEYEKAKAAAKYGLLPEEYKVYPDKGDGIGDYPDLPLTSVESRDPTYHWDFPEYRRNFGEALHHKALLYGEDRYDVCMRPRFSMPMMLAWFLSAMGGSFLLCYLTEDMAFLPVLPKQLPKPGIEHYKFE
ncbi:hypothetical protein AAG570_007005 [Ranatra chinensis]|uniref:NADH dehydrogenase [ubiquinone] 1 beta subcomplex subunit 8, mitochondrial n=1 Tax=Ranatra chinensis TaxID=642074 RepID=A0ABD0YVR3_9HEMI